jgi:hypothetical protein
LSRRALPARRLAASTVGLALSATLAACAATSRQEAAAPAGEAYGASSAPPAPAPQAQAQPGFEAGSTKPRTVDEALAALAKAEQELATSIDSKKAEPLATDRCTVICKALASMRHAASELCELTDDGRCDDAKARLAKAETRAKEACPTCGGA